LTCHVTLRNIGIEGLERKLVEIGTAAVDGKERRGALAYGDKQILVSLVWHDNGLVLGSARVDVKTDEITLVPQSLAGARSPGVAITTDVMPIQRA
jgi:hypothetical protein